MLLRRPRILPPRRPLPRVPPVRLHRELPHRQIPQPQRVPKSRRRLLKVDNPLRVGHLVDAVDRSNPLPLQPGSNALVGRQHELLDQPMRPPSLRPHDGLHIPIRIKLDNRLRQIKVNRPTTNPLRIQPQREVEHRVKRGRQLRMFKIDPLPLGDVLQTRFSHALCSTNRC